jgi:hypothetical protein
MKMETTYSFEKSIDFEKTTYMAYIPEDITLLNYSD